MGLKRATLNLWVELRIRILTFLSKKRRKVGKKQGCGSGSVSGSALIWPAGSGSGSSRAKMTYKNRKKYRIFMFWSTGCSLLRAEGFFCSLSVLYGGLGISKLQFLIMKIKILITSCKFSSILGHQTRIRDPGSGSAIRKNAGSVSGSALNQCRSANLEKRFIECCRMRYLQKFVLRYQYLPI